MKYHTINELDHFCFKEAYIAQICAMYASLKQK